MNNFNVKQNLLYLICTNKLVKDPMENNVPIIKNTGCTSLETTLIVCLLRFFLCLIVLGGFLLTL